MIIKTSHVLTIITFLLTGGVIIALTLFPDRFFHSLQPKEIKPTRIIERGEADAPSEMSSSDENISYKDSALAKVILGDDEILVTVLDDNFDDDAQEEQILAYRSRSQENSPINISYVDFDESSQSYKRVWNVETIVVRPGTIDLYIQDLTGDHIPSVLLSGMSPSGEYSLLVFKKTGGAEPFRKIADIRIEGGVTVNEVERSQAYQSGIANSRSFPITAYGRDAASANILDRIEISYVYNNEIGEYVQDTLTRIPGEQIEEQKLREVLNGGRRSFERFLNGLWYWTASDGSIDNGQYIYFDPQNKEIIFYSDDAQQVFVWQNSSATRYGLYLTAQNVSVQTLRRSLDIALESLNSVHIRVSEDVRLKIGTDASWNGSYKKANFTASSSSQTPVKNISSFIDGVYNGVIGRIHFSKSGSYKLTLSENSQTGLYSFFYIDNTEMLELRPEDNPRITYAIERLDETLSFKRVTISANGIQDHHEPTFSMTPDMDSSVD
jgi:hypothetical protein